MHGNKKYTGEHVVLFMLTVLGDGNVWTVFQGFYSENKIQEFIITGSKADVIFFKALSTNSDRERALTS